jgi:hypothetical protein
LIASATPLTPVPVSKAPSNDGGWRASRD